MYLCGLIIFSAAAYTDCRCRIIPNVLPALLLLPGIWNCVFAGQSFLHSTFSAASVFVIFILVCLVTDANGGTGVGGGDIKLMTAAAFTFGLPMSLVLLLLSHLMACLYIFLKEASARLLLKKRGHGAEIFCSSVPMVPFFLTAYICCILI